MKDPKKDITLEEIIYINEMIRQESLMERNIEYTGYDDYPIDRKKIRSVLERVKGLDLVEKAAGMMHLIIVLQPFADANHRTAIAAAKYLLQKNGHDLNVESPDSEAFQKRLYELRFKTYGTYEALKIGQIEHDDDEVSWFCKKYILEHLL